MADQGLNLHGAGPVHSDTRQDGDFPTRYRKRLVVASLVCGDLVAALAAISCVNLVIEITGLSSPTHQRTTILFAIPVFFVLGLYSGAGPGPYERFCLRSIGIAALFVVSTIATLPPEKIVDQMIIQFASAAALLLAGHYVEAATRSLLVHVGIWGAPTILVGEADDCRGLEEFLASSCDLGLKPIGDIGLGEIVNSGSGRALLPTAGETPDLDNIRLRAAEVAIFTNPRDLVTVPRDCAAFAPSCRFMLLEDFQNIQGPWVRTRTLKTKVGVEIRRSLFTWQNRLLKRTFDILVAVPAALLALPAIAVAALAIKFADPGPAFYVQRRIGHKGSTIKILKLRTMYLDSEQLLEEHLRRDPHARAEWQQYFKLRDDPRILPVVGNIIRRTSADELPQLWNVICGDMSLVGPRPLPAYHAEQFDKAFQLLRTSVPQGITGLWQVSSRSDGDLNVLRERDLFYIHNWSPWLDFYILLQTIPAVLAAKGAR